MSVFPPPPYGVQPPLRILSLDGGGIRGLASLFVVQDLMDRIQVRERLAATPLPCEWFDLIVGTSTGGLIALMLGRLKMSVNDAIDAYKVLSENVFGEETRSWLSKANPISTEPRYSVDNLEAAIRKIAGDTKLADPDGEPKCRVAVVAVKKVDTDALPDLLRSYTTDVPPYICTVLDAARATSAATRFFPPAKVKIRYGLEVTYLDGGLGYNNPTRLALNEAEKIWGSGRGVGCIVSIGTGIPGYVRFEGNKLALAEKLVAISTGCQAVHQEMNSKFGGMQRGVYFRFDPPADLARIGLDEWKKLNDVAELAHAYVHGNEVNLGDCIAAITQPVGI
jgi:predicted acylesterase/phospholipase RssA